MDETLLRNFETLNMAATNTCKYTDYSTLKKKSDRINLLARS